MNNPEIFTGVFGLIIGLVALLLAIYWLLVPVFVLQVRNAVLEQTKRNEKLLKSVIATSDRTNELLTNLLISNENMEKHSSILPTIAAHQERTNQLTEWLGTVKHGE